MYFSHIDVSLPLFVPPFPSKNKYIKSFFRKPSLLLTVSGVPSSRKPSTTLLQALNPLREPSGLPNTSPAHSGSSLSGDRSVPDIGLGKKRDLHKC